MIVNVINTCAYCENLKNRKRYSATTHNCEFAYIYFWDYDRIAKLRSELTGTPSLQLRSALGYAICVKDAIWFEPMSLLSMLEKQATATAYRYRTNVTPCQFVRCGYLPSCRCTSTSTYLSFHDYKYVRTR